MSSAESLSTDIDSFLGKKKRKRKPATENADFGHDELEGQPVPNPWSKEDSKCFPFIYAPPQSVSFLEEEAKNVHSKLYEIATGECEKGTPIPNIVTIVADYYDAYVLGVLDGAQAWSRESIYSWLMSLPLLKQKDRLETLNNTIRSLKAHEFTEDADGVKKPNESMIKLSIMCMKTERDLMMSYKSYNSTQK